MSNLISNRDLDAPLTEAQAHNAERFYPGLNDVKAISRLRAIEAKTGDLDDAVDEAEAAQTAAEAAQAAIADFVYATVQPVFVTANNTRTFRIVPAGIDGTVVSAAFSAVTAASSVLGAVTAVLNDGDDAVSDVEDIDGQTSVAFSGVGAFVNGLTVELDSDNADAVAGAGLQVAVVYKITQ